MGNHDQAGIVTIGQNTLAEAFDCSIAECGVMGVSLTEGAKFIAENCNIQFCRNSGVGVSGKNGFARLYACSLAGNGEYGVMVANEACAQMEGNR